MFQDYRNKFSSLDIENKQSNLEYKKVFLNKVGRSYSLLIKEVNNSREISLELKLFIDNYDKSSKDHKENIKELYREKLILTKNNYKGILQFLKEKNFLTLEEYIGVTNKLSSYFNKKEIYKKYSSNFYKCPNCEENLYEIKKNIFVCENINCNYLEER